MSATPLAPQNLDAEESVLGALLAAGALGSEKAARVAGRMAEAEIGPDDFYRPSHGAIFEAILALADRGDPCDGIAVDAELRAQGALGGAGGRERIHELAMLVPAVTNAAHHATLVGEAARRRRLHQLATAVAQATENGGVPDELADELTEALAARPAHLSRAVPIWRLWQEIDRITREAV